jgi:DNA modification methylase
VIPTRISAECPFCAKIIKRKTMNLEDIGMLLFIKFNLAWAVKSSEKHGFIDFNTIFNIETIEDLKIKEEKFEKKMKQSELKAEKKDKKDTKIEKINKKNNQQGNMNNNMRIDKMFFTRHE